ncbi:MAG: bifunctional chorismate mutase/prephenate dehydratase [Lachnospiraceae bacterium]|nr:bifunctional chorismate mutase/prephenate dehydratase [Lachnospiraceae bacterium]
MEAVEKMASNGYFGRGLRELFSQIMSLSRKYQYTMLADKGMNGFTEGEGLRCGEEDTVAFFGEPGSYTEQASMCALGESCNRMSCSTFGAVVDAVETGTAKFGVVPIENTTTGDISDLYDLMAEHQVYPVAEQVVKIEHVLAAPAGATEEGIKEVYSHPQALMQCSGYFAKRPELLQRACSSTSGCALEVANNNDVTKAAIASEAAAKRYGLTVLRRGLNNENINSTRFLVLSKEAFFVKEADKVSICFEIAHESGSLYRILSHLIYNNLNMTKIESRPIQGKQFEYRFFVDFDGKLSEPAVQNALTGIKEEASRLKVLGCYKSFV